MAITMIITDAGRAALVNAQNTGTAPVTIAECGLSGTAPAPVPADTVLAGEFKRIATLSGSVVAADTIHLIVRDESLDAYTVRSWALYLADGTLFGIYGQVDPLVAKTTQSIMLLAIDVMFANVDAAALTFGDANFLNPPATTTQMGVVELATSGEATAGSDPTLVPPVKAMRDAVWAWLDARFGPNNAAIWHPGNDGAASGMDADLLDGRQGSEYLLTSGFTGAAIRSLLLTVDGAGSGVDSDLLDGQDGAYYANIAARLGFTPVNKAGDTMGGILNLLAGSKVLAENAAAGEGGQLVWAKSNLGTLAGDVAVDINSTAFRIFEMGGSSRGFFLDLNQAAAGANTAIFHSGNDGAGSGMDADMVDGRHASEFVLATSFTAATIRSLLLTVDGAGSGLDADLLDGQDASYYTNIVARLGFTPLNRAGDTITGPLVFGAGTLLDLATNDIWASMRVVRNAKAGGDGMFIGYGNANGGRTRLYGDGSTGGYAFPDVNGNLYRHDGMPYWHAGNDGAGTGMDADTVDGLHASAFALAASFAGSLADNGWISLPGGLILQWGRNRVQTSSTATTYTQAYNVPFSGAAYAVFMSRYDPTGATYNQKHYVKLGDGDGNGFTYKIQDDDSSNPSYQVYGFDWIAIGHA